MATLDVINLEKQKVGTIDLPDEIVNATVDEHLFYEVVKAQLASRRFPLEKVTTHRFGLKEVDLAIRSVGGNGVKDVIHASLMPWQ